MGRKRVKAKLDWDNAHTLSTKFKVVKTLVKQEVRSNLRTKQNQELWKSDSDSDFTDNSEISDSDFQDTFLRNQQRIISHAKDARPEIKDSITPDNAITPQTILQTLNSGIKENIDTEEIMRYNISLLMNKLKSKKKKMTNLKKLSSIYQKSAQEHDELLTSIKSHKRQVKHFEEENSMLKLQIHKQEMLLSSIPDLQDLNLCIQDSLLSRDAEIDRLLGKNIENLELSECFELYNLMNEVVKKLQNEVLHKSYRFQSLAKCVICMENGRSIILQPCGHFCMCEMCGYAVCVCPMCRGCISERILALV